MLPSMKQTYNATAARCTSVGTCDAILTEEGLTESLLKSAEITSVSRLKKRFQNKNTWELVRCEESIGDMIEMY